MTVLHIVTGLTSALTSLTSRYVDTRDTQVVLVLFTSPDAEATLGRQLSRISAKVRVKVVKEPPSEYIRLLSDANYLKTHCGGDRPDELRVFLSHSHWLLNAAASAFPDVGVTLFEEGMAGFYPDTLANLRFLDRVARIEYHDYLGSFRPLASVTRPELFEAIEPKRFLSTLRHVNNPEPSEVIDDTTVIVAEQYFDLKGKSISTEDVVDLYALTVRSLIEKGYRVAYKAHPRHPSEIYQAIRARLSRPVADESLRLIRDRGRILEAIAANERPAAVVAVNSTVMLAIPHLLGIPSFRIDTDFPLRLSQDIPVERVGQLANFLALRDRIPEVADLPPLGSSADPWQVFERRLCSVPAITEDPLLIGLCDALSGSIGPEYPALIRDLLTSEASHCSFDFFDTIATRPVMHPSDIFFLGDRDLGEVFPTAARYSNARNAAIAELRVGDRRRGREKEEYSLRELTDFLEDRMGLPQGSSERLAEFELRLEERVLRTRNAIAVLYLLARRLGKSVGVASDTFHSADDLRILLRGLLPDQPDFVFTSSDHSATKASGALFDVMLKELGIPGESLVHLGDNPRSDGQNPAAYGIASFAFPSTASAAKRTRSLGMLFEGFRSEKSLEIVRGIIANRFFDNPFATHPEDSVTLGSPYALGFGAVGPAMLGWVLWLARQAKAHRYDRLIFAARDGYVPRKIYDRLRTFDPDLPEHLFLATSRRVAFQAVNGSASHIVLTGNVHGLNPANSPRRLVLTRFGAEGLRFLQPLLAEAGIVELDEPLGRTRLAAFRTVLVTHAKAIAAVGASRAEAASVHYGRAVAGSSHPALVDLGYSGSTQRAMMVATSRKVDGLYFVTMEHALEYESILDVSSLPWSQDRTFFTYGSTLEYLMTPMDLPECVGVEPCGRPVFSSATEATGDPVNSAIQHGLGDFIEDVFQRFGEDVFALAMRPDSATRWLSAFLGSPSKSDAQLLANAVQDDSAGSGTSHLLDNWRPGRAVLGR